MTIQELTTVASKLLSEYHQKSLAEGTPAWTREDLMRGLVVDVGELMRLTMAKEGKRTEANVDARLGHELADCLWSVLLLAHSYEIDLESELSNMVNSKLKMLSE